MIERLTPIRLLVVITLCGTCPPALAAENCHGEQSAQTAAADPDARYTRSSETYDVPDVTLVNQRGENVDLKSVLDPGAPVALNFVFTTCTTICPVMTATFSRLQRELGDDAADLHLVSISIDPEYDTPPVLGAYARKYGADTQWQFLTGGRTEIAEVLQAFHALSSSKMSHKPFTIFRMPGEDHWVRIEGLTSSSDLAQEYRRLLAQ